ncbi:hypothetical protein MXB_3358, partial [Myxobolus squamalis]
MHVQHNTINFDLIPSISQYKYVEFRINSHIKYQLHIHTDFHKYRNFESNEKCLENDHNLKCNRRGEIVCRNPCKSNPPKCI